MDNTLIYAAIGAVTIISLTGFGYVIQKERRRLQEEMNQLVPSADNEAALEPPELDSSLAGLVGYWRHLAKSKKLAKRGYVKWYKVDSTMQRPKWVKPTPDGAGVPEYYDSGDDVTYLFPKDAMISDAQTGAYVAVHRSGEAEPINLRDPAMPAIPADRLEEVINLEAESEAPGFFSRLDLDPKMILWFGIALMLVMGALQQFMG